MAPDPYRTLGLARGASLDDVRSAYRRLAKANHPDRAGEAALPRFLAIQAAYDQIAGPDGGPRPVAGSRPDRAWSTDRDRSGATHRAYGGRARRTRASGGPRPGAGSDAGESTEARPGAGSGPSRRRDRPDAADRPDRPPNKATLGSTSYDGVDAEAFEPDWGGASWYGTTSGTYWTLNPKEYADPRKHGPEYQARARRQRKGAAVDPVVSSPADPTDPTDPTDPVDPADIADSPAGPAAEARAGTSVDPPTGGPSADPPTGAPEGDPPGPGAATGFPPRTHTSTSWWQATAGGPTRTTTTGAGSTGAEPTTPPFGRQTGPGRRTPGAPGRPASPRPARAKLASESVGDFATDTIMDGLRAWLGDGRPGVGARVGRAVVGWAPIALGIGWLAGEITGCGRFSADCDPAVAPVSWLAQIAALVLLILVSAAARVATTATIATLAAIIPGSILLLATHDPGAINAGRSALGGLMIIAWGTGLAYGLAREARTFRRDRGPHAPGPVS